MNQTIRKHIRNFCFLMLTFATGLFYFCFYLVGITFGVGMAFTLVGLPILHYVLRSTETFVQYERIQTKVYTDISTCMVPSRTKAEGGLWEQLKADLLDVHNWRMIFWLMMKLAIGFVSIICASLFYVTPLFFLFAPILYPLIPLSIFGIEIKTLDASFLVMVAGAIWMWIGSYLGNVLVKMIGGHTRRIIKAFVRR